MKTINSLIVLSYTLFFLTISCNKKEELSHNVQKIESSKIDINEGYQKWLFYKISDASILDEETKSIEEIKNELENTVITLKDSNTIDIKNYCNDIEYVILNEKSMNYFITKDYFQKCAKAFLSEGIEIKKDITIIRSVIPSEECLSPFNEILKIDNYLIVIYEGRLIFYSPNSKTDIATSSPSNILELSNATLPYEGKILPDEVVYNKIDVNKIKKIDEFSCGNKEIRYIPLPFKDDINIILVPLDCGDFNYRYHLLTIKNNEVVDNLYVEGEWYEPEDYENIEYTSFKVDPNFNIEVITKINKVIQKSKYTIDYSGKIIKI